MPTSLRRELWTVAAVLVLAVGLAACDRDDRTSSQKAAPDQTTADGSRGPLPDVGPVQQRVELLRSWKQIRSDFSQGRMSAVCKQIGGFGMRGFPAGSGDAPGSCPRQLRWFAARLREKPPAEDLSVGGVRAYPEQGIGGITLADRRGLRTRVPFELDDHDRWLIELGVFDRPEVLLAPGAGTPLSLSVATRRPAQSFAPFVKFHPRELWWPLGASRFLDLAILSWADPVCLVEEVAIGASRREGHRDQSVPIVDPSRVGGRHPYRHRPRRADCSGREMTTHATTDSTVPYSSHTSRGGPRYGLGFVLDIATGARSGIMPVGRDSAVKAPVYYEERPERVDGVVGVRVTYWMLFGFERPLPEAKGLPVEHEGDWERVSVLLRRVGPRRYAPVSVRYHQAARDVDTPWTSVAAYSDRQHPALATHPGTFLARGTHNPYPSPGIRRRPMRAPRGTFMSVEQAADCSSCPSWKTWLDLEALDEQPWRNYGGAWGDSALGPWRTGVAGPP